jgi:hypothetical protein
MDTKELEKMKSIQNQSQNDHRGNQDYYPRDPGYVSPGDRPRWADPLTLNFDAHGLPLFFQILFFLFQKCDYKLVKLKEEFWRKYQFRLFSIY